MAISSLAYVGFNVTDMPRWHALLCGVFGAELAEDSGGVSKFRVDRYRHRITLENAASDSVGFIGWELADVAALEDMVSKLRAEGVAVEKASEALCQARNFSQIYTFTDPHLMMPTEIATGPVHANMFFKPSRDVAPFNVDQEVGLGHLVIWVADLQAGVKFYTDVLGFKVSDTMAWDDNEAVFMHCNKRHHTIALMAEAEGRPAGKLGHLMLEGTAQDDVGRGYDLARDAGFNIMLEPGKHTNDLMQSFYLETPSGFWMEYGFGGRLIEGEWTIEHFDAPMLWGHRMVAP